MIIREAREEIASVSPDAVVLDNPSFDRAIIELTEKILSDMIVTRWLMN